MYPSMPWKSCQSTTTVSLPAWRAFEFFSFLCFYSSAIFLSAKGQHIPPSVLCNRPPLLTPPLLSSPI
ncbi:unnamed protein product [Gadus morhua 'NCC']